MEQTYSAPLNLPLTPLPQEMPPPSVPITVHGAGLAAPSVEMILSRDRETRWLPFSVGALLVIFAFAAARLAMGYVGAVEGMFLMALLPVVLVLMLFGYRSRKNNALKQRLRDMRLYMGAVNGGVTTTVYPDRIEQRTARVTRTVHFTETTVFTEHYDWMLVETDSRWVAIAAADVTPWEAQSIFELIAAAVPPTRQFTRGDFCARRTESAPPPFSTTPPVCYERVEGCEEQVSGFVWPAGSLSWLFAAALSVSDMFTTLFAITSSFFLDYLILFSACFAVGVIALLFAATRQVDTPSAAVLSFTSEGLLVERAGDLQFVMAADVRARRTENGMKLFTPAGVFTVPWALTKNRQQLEWMLFSR